MERWTARERNCGRTIEVLRDPATTTPIVPEVCPQCGARPVYVDLLELLEASASAEGAPIRASSAAVELAEASGVDLQLVRGSGKDGAIIRSDVQAWIDATGAGFEALQAETLAQLADLDPTTIAATGADGRLTRKDVVAAIAAAYSTAPAAHPAA